MTTDRATVRIVAGGLLLLAIITVVGLLAVVIVATDLPTEARTGALVTVGAIGTTAAGAGAALLASTRSNSTPEPANPADLLPQ